MSETTPPKKKIPYFLTVINKLEHWDTSTETVCTRYSDGPIGCEMQRLVKAWGTPGEYHEAVPVSATYDTFPGSNKAPSARIGRQGSQASMLMLRSLLHCLLVDGEI